jgi:hypothetical protein
MEVINNDSNNNKRKENGLHKHKGRNKRIEKHVSNGPNQEE